MQKVRIKHTLIYFIVDDVDYNRVSCITWYLDNSSGKPTKIWADNPKVTLGRYILDYAGPLDVDHKDRDIFNNIRENLRVATRSQNCANRAKITKPCSSKYKGVYWNKRDQKWIAYIKVNGRMKNLGQFDTEEEAAKRYDRAAKKYFGEFAILNFPIKEKE